MKRIKKGIADNQTAIIKLAERKIALDAKIVVLESEIALREKNAPVIMGANMEIRERMAEN